MKIIRYVYRERICYGILENGAVTPVSSPFDGAPFVLGAPLDFRAVRLLAPSAPTKICAAGLNYKSHTAELNEKTPSEPVFFIKPPSSVIAHGDTVPLWSNAGRTDYEGELAAVIGTRARNISPEAAKSHILGFTALNDVTARVLQKKDGQWTRAKGFDGYCPFGPWIETGLDPLDLAVVTRKNGVTVQSGRTSSMIWDIYTLVSFISGVMTLEPGDVVSSGTPEGIGEAFDGDTVSVEIEGLGALVNKYGKSEQLG